MASEHLIFSYSKIVLHWGFIVRQLGASAAQLAYVLPPPPTVVGAFMNPLARILGLGERLDPDAGVAGSKAMECALKATIAASAGLTTDSRVGLIVYGELSRISSAIYRGEDECGDEHKGKQRKRRKKDIYKPIYLAANTLLPVQAVGSTSSPQGKLVLVWLVDIKKLEDCLKVPVDQSHLEKASWNVYRLGSREGLAAVERAGALRLGEFKEEFKEISEGKVFRSILYQPVECVNPLEQTAKVTLYDWSCEMKEDKEGQSRSYITYIEKSFFVPSRWGGPAGVVPPVESVRFEVKSGSKCRAARLRLKEFDEYSEEYTIAYPIERGDKC